MGVQDTIAGYFDLDGNDTNVQTELLAGLTTFLTMSYIIIVNPALLMVAITPEGVSDVRVFQMLAVVTILASVVGMLVMAFYADRPFGLAPGMGLNAFFVAVVLSPTLNVTWQTALAAVFVEGVLFILLTAVGAREYIINLFPAPVKFAVGTGIGAFLAIIGLEAMRVVAGSSATFVTFSPVFASDPVAIISVVGLFLTFVLYARGVRGSIVIGILLTTVMGYIARALGYTAYSPEQASEIFGVTLSSASLVSDVPITYDAAGYNIAPLAGAFISGFGNVEVFTFALVVFTFFFVDFFDTAGTLTGVSQIAGFLDEEGDLPDMDKPLMADAVGTTVGGILGTSTVTTYIESATGVEEGGRTGMTALVVGVLFLVSLVVVPVAAAIPLYASHIALVVVAIIMLSNVTEVDWDDITHAVPAGLTILVMPFTFSIAYGIAAGIISYPIVKAATGEWREIHPGQWVLAGAFVVYFFVRTGGVL